MKKLLLLMVLFLVLTNSQSQQQVIKYPGYTSYFNTQTKIPDSVTWKITQIHLTGQKTPRTNQFHSTGGRQNLKRDYENSGYDQGHNSPYDDNYFSDSAEYQCFDYANMFPQRHLLNAQPWELLEVYSRRLAFQYGHVNVKTSWSGVDKKIGVDSVVVPLYCIKEIWYDNGKYEKYVMPNKDTVIKHPYTYYSVKK